MKSQQRKSNCNKENAQLLSAIELYNKYISDQLKLIEDFDIWYEQKFQKDFPKCWYTIIKTGKE